MRSIHTITLTDAEDGTPILLVVERIQKVMERHANNGMGKEEVYSVVLLERGECRVKETAKQIETKMWYATDDEWNNRLPTEP